MKKKTDLLDGAEHHVSATAGRQPVEPAPDPVHGDDVQVLGAGVVGAVHHGAHGAGQRDAELGSRRSSASPLRHAGFCNHGGQGGSGQHKDIKDSTKTYKVSSVFGYVTTLKARKWAEYQLLASVRHKIQAGGRV